MVLIMADFIVVEYYENATDSTPKYKYEIRNMDSISYNSRVDAIQEGFLEITNDRGEKKYSEVFKTGGVVENISVSWIIIDEASDVSLGTYPGGIRTIKEQIAFFREFLTNSVSDKVRINMTPIGLPVYEGYVVDFNANVNLTGRSVACSLRFLIGKVLI